ncbi:cell division protein ZapA [Pseudomonas sp. MAP12]|uniref:Cell division protein ZapA n=1 Tax=Geopseudomonas aromaticivorans TaxID=2849492 RepID=A0ABS6N172_9GAMM|nr:cell division protein ZapA [Pseudomonas aromaticivorans]MBV2134535.1 cell division protein ZapA [Pseudomonas aromaticivorans]
MKENGVRVLNILGRDYSIKAPASEERVLQQAAALLNERLDDNQQRFPGAGIHELLVLTALNLCVPLLRQDEQLREVQERLAASVERINRQLQG